MKNFIISASVFFGICVIYFLIMISKTEGNFTYILDDAYIHLAIAKNFALHDVWGMTKYSFSSSSSSPIFTFILSVLIIVFGNNELIPLVFNVAVSLLIIVFLNRYYSSFFDKNKHIIIASLFTLFFAVLHIQIFTGMEHSLQVLIVIVNIFYFQKWIKSDFKDQLSSYWFYATILLLGLVRFESMFYFVSLAFVFLLIKRYKEVVLTLILGFVPILIFGYFNYQKDGYFFPNSVVVKGTSFNFSGNYIEQIKEIVFRKIILNIKFYQVALFPLLIGVVFIYKDYKSKLSFQKIIINNFLIIAWSLTLMLQCVFGEFKGPFRYEAYLLTAFSMIVIPRLKHFFINPLSEFKKEKFTVAILIVNFILLIYKFGFAHLLITQGSENIYEQQIQSAKFLKKYYNNSSVVANDIGAICYFSDIHLLDFVGLGSTEMIPFSKKGAVMDNRFKNYLTKYCKENNYQLAIVYEEWLRGQTPENWKKVAVLTIKNNVVVGQDHIFIYSINPKIHESLKQNVKDFKWNKNVDVNIIE
ncbi:hypothetical protein A0O34_06875 [Chryseobacterium glaciei]|uniref:Glycosyltransferase RgtA/B/C/D-like domain-containing protein n=1 Tax=Chryseobacterium glaciei TaxID=1685010 RepID=A0A172XTB0_9FLAO|nr:hypothetical protein [Chryseobacterium glaciei]ANF50257.1 hypothetical protein A0O34_06875 [Chryseobacterium glaciei]